MSTRARSATAAKEAWGLFWQLFLEDKGRRAAILSELGLAPMQAHALTLLEPGTPLTMGELAAAMHCDNSNVTGIADRLETAGHVARRPCDHDRRVKELVLTTRGEAARAEIEARLSVPPPRLAALSAADQRTLRDVLRRAMAD